MMGKEVLAAGRGGARSVFIKGGSGRQGPGCDDAGFQEADLGGGRQAEGGRGGTGSRRGNCNLGPGLSVSQWLLQGQGCL